MINSLQTLRALALSMVALVLAVPAVANGQPAEPFPSRVVKIVVPYAAGGSTDAIARLLAQGMTKALGQQVIVENRPGANGLIGTEAVARSPADGYTLLLGPIATNAIAGSLYADLRYDPVKDFVAITEVARSPLLLVVGPSIPASTLPQLIAYAKEHPNKLTYASGGEGTASHVGAALFVHRAQLTALHIPYRGSGLALNDVMGGHADIMFDSIATSLQNVRAGKLKAIGISTPTRSDIAPEIPTLDEVGLRGFTLVWWFGLFAPRGTPPEIVAKLSQSSAGVLKSPQTRDAFIALGLEPVGSTSEEFGRKVVEEAASWGKVISDAGIKAGK